MFFSGPSGWFFLAWKKTTSWGTKKQQGVCVFFGGGEGETKKHVGTEMVSWLLLMKNLRSMVIYEDKGR